MSNINQLLEDYGDQVISKMKRILTTARKRATGSLINSIEYKIKDNEIEVGYEPYGEFVAAGRKAGSKPPPIEPIISWIKVKRISLGQGKSKSMVQKGKKAPKESQIKGMAFAISKSIGKKGIPATDFLQPLDVFTSAKFQKDLKEAIISDIMDALKNK